MTMKKCAIAIIFSPDKSAVLLVKRRDIPVWVLPGGGIDANESPQLAAVREALEETGLTVKIERPVAEYSPINRLASQTYTYQCQAIGGALTTGNETRGVQFFPLDQLPESLFFIHRQWLDDALMQANFLICRPLNQVTYGKLAGYFIRHPVQVLRMLLARLGMPLNS